MRHVRLIHLSKEESKEQRGASAGDANVSPHANFATSAVSNTSIDEINTQVNLRAFDNTALFFDDSILDTFPFEQQQTGSIPAIQASSGESKLETRDSRGVSYASQMRALVKSSGIYALTSLVSPFISLVLAPFLTRNLTHTAYGALAVLNTAIALLAALTQLGLNAAFFRAYNYDYESRKDRLSVISTVVVLISLTSLCTALTIVLTAPRLSLLLFNTMSFSDAVKVAALVLLVQNLAVPGFAWLRAENRALLFSLLSIANLLITLGANLLLVGMFHMGIDGSLIATASGFAFVGICTLPVILLHAGLSLRFEIARGLLSFGVPMIFSIVSVWVLQLSDRFLLSRLGSLAQVASYSVAYSLGSIVSVVVLSPFTLAWPSALFTIARKDNAPHIFKIVFRWFSMALLFVAFALTYLSTTALHLFFPPAYHSADSIIPIIVMSTVFYGIYNIFTTGISIQRKTWFAVVFTASSAFVNVAINLVLIPLYGSMGAAVSTLLAYMLLVFIAYIVNQRLYHIPYEIGIFVIELFIGIALYMGSDFLARNKGTYEVWGIYMGALSLYGGSLAFLAKFSTRIQKNKS